MRKSSRQGKRETWLIPQLSRRDRTSARRSGYCVPSYHSPVFQTAYMPIKGKLFCFWCNFFFVFRFFLYVGLVKQLGDLKRKKTFLSLAKKRKCGFHPFFFEDLFNSLYEDTHFFSLRLSYLFNTPVVGWELSVKHKFCTYKESLRNFRDLLFRG